MVNTHIIPQEFTYHEPRSLAEAVSLLQTHGSSARVLAGGTDLLVQMKLGKIQPQHLIYISKIPELQFLTEGQGLRIGPLIVHRDLEKSSVVREKFTALFEAARSVTSVQVRSMGTVGGNLCHASPAADSAPALIALGAQIKIAGGAGAQNASSGGFLCRPPGRPTSSPANCLRKFRFPIPGPPPGALS